MFEHTKRQVKVFFFPEMRLYFLMFVTAVCFLFLLRIRKVGVRPWAAIFFLFYGNTLNNRSKCLKNGSNRLRKEIYMWNRPRAVVLRFSEPCAITFTIRYFHSLFNRLLPFFSFLSCFFFRNGFNILLYGLGSKRVLLDQFRSSKLSSYIQIVVNGYFPSLTIKSVSLLFIFRWYCNLLA